MHLLNNPVAILFLSFAFGVVADPLLRRTTNYNWLSTRYLFSNLKAYENLGVLWFRKILLATPFGKLNNKICFTRNRDLKILKGIREHIATAEVSHWVGFVTMLALTVWAWWYHGSRVGLACLVLNIIGNLYPCMLQQYNKRRLFKVISVLEQRDSVGHTD